MLNYLVKEKKKELYSSLKIVSIKSNLQLMICSILLEIILLLIFWMLMEMENLPLNKLKHIYRPAIHLLRKIISIQVVFSI